MPDIDIRIDRRAGHITLTREKALNALSYDMCLAVEDALDRWRDDPNVALVIIDAAGDRAFCAGGDIAEMYRTGKAGDYAYGRQFWRDEYRLNAKLAEYPKPVVSFLHGFVMGGGVGLGGHCSHRITCETTQVSMPEVGIGFVPDVGGSYLLARAPGRLGDYLGLTAARMDGADAIYAGFADVFVPQDLWPELKDRLAETGDIAAIDAAAQPVPDGALSRDAQFIDDIFGAGNLSDIVAKSSEMDGDLAKSTHKALTRNAPLSMAVTLEMLSRLRALPAPTIRDALVQEYRVSHRIMEQGDFLEGIRAAIIDKDRSPNWRYALGDVPDDAVQSMLAPLDDKDLNFRELEQ